MFRPTDSGDAFAGGAIRARMLGGQRSAKL